MAKLTTNQDLFIIVANDLMLSKHGLTEENIRAMLMALRTDLNLDYSDEEVETFTEEINCEACSLSFCTKALNEVVYNNHLHHYSCDNL